MEIPLGNATDRQLPDRRWQELCTHIRTTDDISFKLLGLVPTLSIAGIAVALLKGEPRFTPLLVLLSLFAGTVTVALWIWERRNIQTCMWLRARAADLETEHQGPSRPGQFYALPSAPGLKGKEYAERLVYRATTAAWLLLPAAVFLSDAPSKADIGKCVGAAAYVAVAICIGVFAWRALTEPIQIEPKFPSPKSDA